jgi:conjugal transfer pilus assembly protein TraA
MTTAIWGSGNPARQFADAFGQATTRLTLWVMGHKKAILITLAVLALLFLVVGIANGGTTGTEFQGIYDKIKDWTSGYLGRSIAAFAFLLGLGAGVAQGSPIPAIAGVVFALFVSFGPAVLEGIATATV